MNKNQLTKDLQYCLAYCQEQNGRDSCKNCGLSPEMIDAINANVEQLLREAMPEVKKYPEGKCMNLENHMFGSCFECKKIEGFNSALSQFKENLLAKRINS